MALASSTALAEDGPSLLFARSWRVAKASAMPTGELVGEIGGGTACAIAGRCCRRGRLVLVLFIAVGYIVMAYRLVLIPFIPSAPSLWANAVGKLSQRRL